MKSIVRVLTLLVILSVPTLRAQGSVQPVGEAYFDQRVAVLGETLVTEFGDPRVGGAAAALALSDGFGPVNLPGLGAVLLDPFSAAFSLTPLPSDAQGNVALSLAVPNDPALLAAPPLFAAGLMASPLLPGGWSLSRTARIEFAAAGSFRGGPSGATARAFHQVTALGVGGRDPATAVLLSGGGGGDVLAPQASTSTELLDPVTHTVTAGPAMSVPRAFHRATRLADGRVLITGGTDSAGTVTAGCEVFDPLTGSLSPAASMSTPRVAHAATLLGDGRVLVSGGLTTYAQALTNAFVVMNTALDSAELYDPVTDTWTPVTQAMASKRSGHTQTLLPDGRVLLVSGINGAVSVLGFGLPTYTATCETFDPATDSFAAAPAIAPGRAFHGASVLSNGAVLISGGLAGVGLFGSAATIDSCLRLSAGSWQSASPLPQSSAFHVQVPVRGGAALIAGGLTGDINGLSPIATAVRHDGVVATPLGAASARAAAGAARLVDGSLLIQGGIDASGQPTAASEIFVDE